MTKEEARESAKWNRHMAEVKEAWADGKPITLGGMEFVLESPDFRAPPKSYRIKPEPKPPKYRAWEPEEVPVPLWFRFHTNPHSPCLCVGIHDGEVQYYGAEGLVSVTLNHLNRQATHLASGQWLPCGVLEDQP